VGTGEKRKKRTNQVGGDVRPILIRGRFNLDVPGLTGVRSRA